MGKYKKCPRCELNWIANEESLCEVCKAELGKASKISLLEEDDEDAAFEERICPICKVNYLEGDEDICPTCRAEQADKADKIEEDNWQDYIDDEEPITREDDETVSLSQLQEEEDEDEEEENPEPDDFEEIDDDFEFDDSDDEEEEADEEDYDE